MHRQQEIQDEVKVALKPYYYNKEITKEEYKYIYKRAVKKVNITYSLKPPY